MNKKLEQFLSEQVSISDTFPDERLSRNFRLSEFFRSYIARSLQINNFPKGEKLDDVSANLQNLCKYILQPIRTAFGSPIYVTSGYRCSKLNKAVGGAKNSYHLYGRAADISASNLYYLMTVISTLVEKGSIHPTELIIHDSYIHIAL